MTDPLLEQLRAVFFDELADLLAILEEQARRLVQEGLSGEERRGAALEIRRAAHSLKGAARAVDYRDVERVCHQLEAELAPARDESSALDIEAARSLTLSAVEELQSWAASQGKEPAADRAEPPAAAPPPALDLETVRVPISRISDISTFSEELVTEAARAEREAGDLLIADEIIAELRRHVQLLARGQHGGPVLEAHASLQALAAWSLEQRRRQRGAWSSLRTKAGRLMASTRGLRASRLEVLRPVLERTVKETAEDVGKPAELVFQGGEAEVDRRVAERLREPLVHLLRNAVDHGLEHEEERRRAGKAAVGRVEVQVRAAGTEVVLSVADDGRGLDQEALRRAAKERGIDGADPDDLLSLLFEPGFTTRGAATPTSGRGIGLDVVRHRVAELQGRVVVDDSPGRGTRFTVVVPADLSITRGQVVSVRGRPFVLVETAVQKASRVRPPDERIVEGRRYLLDGESLVPLADLGAALGFGAGEPQARARPAVVLAAGDRRVAYLVDELHGSVDVVVKPLGPRVRRAPFVSGATVLAEGDVACVLDAFALAQYGRAERMDGAAARAPEEARRVLVVDDSVTTRQLLSSLLEAAGYRVETAIDGEVAWRRLLAEDPPDLVVSDIEMPRVDGFALLSRMRGSPETARLPVILVTALASDADRRRALELGADAYVVKGRFDQQALLDSIEELLP